MNEHRLPADVAVLAKFIYRTEVGAVSNPYVVIFGNRQNRLSKPITSMTLRELQANQRNWGNRTWVRNNWGLSTSSSAAGAVQLMRATGEDVFQKLKLDLDKTKFTPDLQDDITWYLLRRRGLDDWRFGRIDDIEFGKRLAQEWASFPVLKNTRGAHRNVKRGQSFYTGDALNKSLTSPETVERVLREARAAREAEGSRNAPPAPKKGPSATDALVGVGAGAGGAAVAVEAAPDELTQVIEHVGIFGASGSQVLAVIGAVLLIGVTGLIVWRMYKNRK